MIPASMVAVLVAALVALRPEQNDRTTQTHGFRVLAPLYIGSLGSLLALLYLARLRASGAIDASLSEVRVVERMARELLGSGSPYLDVSALPVPTVSIWRASGDLDFDDWSMTLEDSGGSSVYERWNEQLRQYLEGQDGVEAFGSWSQPHPPWPELDNPMTGYLIEQAAKIYESDGLESALAWAPPMTACQHGRVSPT